MTKIYSLCLTLIFLSTAAIAETKNFDIKGTWEGKARDGTVLQYTFTKAGLVTWIVKHPKFKQAFPKGLTGKFKVTILKPYAHLDITDFDSPQFKGFKFLGIFQIINKKSFKLEAARNPAGPRIKYFTPDAIEFKLINS